MKKKDTIKKFTFIFLLVVFCLGVMVYSLLPSLSDFRDSIWGMIISFLFVLSITLFVILSKKINMPLIGKITVMIFAMLYIFLCVIDLGKIELVFFLIYSVANIIITIYLYLKRKKEYKSIWIFGAFSYILFASVTLRVHYTSGEFTPTLLIPSIIAAVIVFLPCLVYGIDRFKSHRDTEKLICAPLLGLLGGFILTWLSLASLNVCLDFSKPQKVEYTIIDMRVRTGARQITAYELKVENEKESFYINVPEAIYYDKKVNDTITLSLYEGAFNESYYIADSFLQD